MPAGARESGGDGRQVCRFGGSIDLFCQWMVDPVEDGGLDLDPATAAAMVGHDDGGYLIATVYTQLAQRRALARAQRAMDAYQERQAATTA
jgi:hypothetical protein